MRARTHPTCTPDLSAPRGQALVELAFILPVLALLLVLSVDFGRVFFGWVALQNAARIGANHAAMHPDAWEAPGIAAMKQEYRDQVVRDMQAINLLPSGRLHLGSGQRP